MVLTEVLNFYSKGTTLREAAASSAQSLRSDPNVTIVPQTSLQFQNALELYKERSDKEWSLTDCASILIMKEMGITAVLTHDTHFRQAGFTPVLRDETKW
jgi:predicted nucleic acid-binding protein